MAESLNKEKDSTTPPAAPSPYEDDVEAEDEDAYIPYSQRPGWSDVVPILPYADATNILVIEYSPKFLDVFSYFRGVMSTGEKSRRVLDLTAEAIELNAANYTVWQYRRDILQAFNVPKKMTRGGLDPELKKEFDFSLLMIEENQKNYQVWHHRKILAQWAADYDEEKGIMNLECQEARLLLFMQELELTARLLAKDAKNYHAWQHRQWVLSTFNCFEHELSFVDNLLEEDVRNNSAWNQRFFAIKKMGNITPELVNREIMYTWAHILKAPSNESPWSYLEGIFRLIPAMLLEKSDEVITLIDQLLSQKIKSSPMLCFVLRMYEQKFLAGKLTDEMNRRAIEYCDLLVSTDKVRYAYWNYMKGKFETNYKKS